MDDDVATKRAFMGNWVRQIKWDWDGNLHAGWGGGWGGVNAAGFGFYNNFVQAYSWHLHCSG